MNRRRVLRFGVVAAIVLAVLVASILAILPQIVHRVVVWQLGKATYRAVTLARVEVSLVRGRLALHGLQVADHDQQPLATAERVEIRFSPRALLRGHVHLFDGTIQSPVVRIVRTGPAEFNISDLLRREPTPRSKLAATVDRFTIDNGLVSVEDRTLNPSRTWRVDRVTLGVQQVSTLPGAPPGVVTLDAIVDGAPLSVRGRDVRLEPLGLHATVDARDVNAGLAGLSLPPGSPLTPARGTVNVSGTVAHDATSGTQVTLDVGLSDLELRRPEQDVMYLSAPSARLKLDNMRVHGGAIDLARLDAEAGTITLQDTRFQPVRRWQVTGLALEARDLSSARGSPAGTANARVVIEGAPVTVSVSGLRLAPVELSATATVRNVDATLARLYMPPGLPVQLERGTIDGSVKLEHDAKQGTRMAVDASIGNLDVRRPGHVVTAPVIRVAAADVALGAGTVRVGRATVRSDALTIEDRTLTPVRRWPVRGLTVEANQLSSRREDVQGTATARASVAGATVSAWLTGLRLDPLELHALTVVRDADVGLARLYLPQDVPFDPRGGIVNGSFHIDHAAATGTRFQGDATVVRLEARVQASPALTVTAPSLRLTVGDGRRQGERLDIARVELGGSAVVTDPRAPAAPFNFERLQVTGEALTWPARSPARLAVSVRLRDGSEIDARGTAQVVSPPPKLAWKADLDLDLRSVNVAPLGRYVPALAGVDGQARGKLGVAIAQSDKLSARVKGDASASRLALTEAGRTPMSIRRLELNGLDVQWPERVQIANVRLVRPRALVERDRAGRFPILARFAAAAPPASPPAPPSSSPSSGTTPSLAVAVTEVVVEDGGGVLVDQAPPVSRFEVPRISATVRDVTWPARAPARVKLDATLPEDGTLAVDGTVQLTSTTPSLAWKSDLNLEFRAVNLGLVARFVPALAGVDGRARGKVSASVSQSDTLTAQVRGDVTGARLALAQPGRGPITVRRLDLGGLDVQWPERVTVAKVRLVRPRAVVERDREGRFPIMARFAAAAPAADSSSAPPASPRPALAVTVGEVVVESGSGVLVDEAASDPARFEVPRIDATVHDVTWPSKGPARVKLDAGLPQRGTLAVEGTMTTDPVSFEVKLVVTDGELGLAQPYATVPARLRGRVDATLNLAGKVAPALTITGRGQASVRGLAISDGSRQVLTVEQIETAGLEVAWPSRVTLDAVKVRKSWALLERDKQGAFVLQQLFTQRPGRPGAPSTTAPAPTPAAPAFEVAFREGVFEEQGATIVDATTSPPFRLEITGARLAVQDFVWPARRPLKVRVTSPVLAEGKLDIDGTLNLDPLRVQAHVKLDEVAITPLQPYLAIEGRVAGRLSGDMTLDLAAVPLNVKMNGEARLVGLRLRDQDRLVGTVGRTDLVGIDVAWPGRAVVKTVELRRPWFLLERDATGDFPLKRLLLPHWTASPSEAGSAPAPPSASGARPAGQVAATPPRIDVETFRIQGGSVRFVDLTLPTPYIEELSPVVLTVNGITTAPGQTVRLAGVGDFPGGSKIKVQGEFLTGEKRRLELRVELEGFVVPRANSYLEQYTSWTATRGSMKATATYRLEGTQISAKHDVVVSGLDVAATDRPDEVKQRLGLPLSLIVSMMKNARGEIHLAVPASADLATGEYVFREALWNAIGKFASSVITLPFSRVGSIFVSPESSKVEAVAIEPVVFEPGEAQITPAMEGHLARIANLLREKPALRLGLVPVVTVTDTDVLKRVAGLQPDARVPMTAVRNLALRRLAAAREKLGALGVDTARLIDPVRETSFVDAKGVGRVDLDLRP